MQKNWFVSGIEMKLLESPHLLRITSCQYIVVFNFIPLGLIAILYIIIYLKLKSHKIPGEQLANVGKQRQQRERNVLKMTIAIVLGFAVC